MPLDAIPDDAFKIILRALYVVLRVLYFVGWELCYGIVGWGTGWVILRVVTFGFYPKVGLTQKHDIPLRTEIIVCLTGLFSVAIALHFLSQMLLAQNT